LAGYREVKIKLIEIVLKREAEVRFIKDASEQGAILRI
jgi:hypothetical protein